MNCWEVANPNMFFWGNLGTIWEQFGASFHKKQLRPVLVSQKVLPFK
jgi:hypothetical protein